jgi:hypothetical protein
LFGAAIVFACQLIYLAPVIARQAPRVSAGLYSRLRSRFIGAEANRSDAVRVRRDLKR